MLYDPRNSSNQTVPSLPFLIWFEYKNKSKILVISHTLYIKEITYFSVEATFFIERNIQVVVNALQKNMSILTGR